MNHRRWMPLTTVAALICTTGASAQALHGFCAGCMDETPGGAPVTSSLPNPPVNFGFWSAAMGGLSGAYTVDVLTPDNGGAAPSGTSFMISGGATANSAAIFAAGVPEPATLGLLVLGLLGTGGSLWLRRRASPGADSPRSC